MDSSEEQVADEAVPQPRSVAQSQHSYWIWHGESEPRRANKPVSCVPGATDEAKLTCRVYLYTPCQ
jgi:hypothetical protein